MKRVSLDFNKGPGPCNLVQYLPPPRIIRAFDKFQVKTSEAYYEKFTLGSLKPLTDAENQ